MSLRGISFMTGWVGAHLPGNLPADRGIARTLTSVAAMDARKAGVTVNEIEEEIGSIEAVIFEALVN